jgi:hypothetical protein
MDALLGATGCDSSMESQQRQALSFWRLRVIATHPKHSQTLFALTFPSATTKAVQQLLRMSCADATSTLRQPANSLERISVSGC